MDKIYHCKSCGFINTRFCKFLNPITSRLNIELCNECYWNYRENKEPAKTWVENLLKNWKEKYKVEVGKQI